MVTLEELHRQCNIDADDTEQDDLLLDYAAAAKSLVLAYIGRSEVELLDVYGAIPAPLRQAVRLLVGDMFANREAGRPASAGNPLAGVGFLINPYRNLQ